MIPENLKDKVPPHNIEAELAALGALLIDPESLDDIIKYIRPEDFYKKSHQTIFKAILDLYNASESIDIITLSDKLRHDGSLEIAGGSAFISQLTNAVPSSANIEYYARIVQGCSVRRKLLRIAHTIIKDAHDDTQESRLLVEEAERHIFEITDSQESGQIQTAGDVIQLTFSAIEKLYNTKDNFTGIPTGFPELDSMTSGFQKSELIIIGARPSVGKTAYALTLASNMAIHHHKSVGFFTLEMSSLALMQRILAAESRTDSGKLRTGLLKPSDFHSLTEAAGRIYEAPLYIEDTPNIKLLDLRAQARRMKTRYSIEILFIDYITLITSENSVLPRHEQIAEISRSLKSLARELDIPVVVLSQVRRETEGKRPSLADLRESGSIEQDADVVMFLHRERGTEKTQHDQPSNNIETELIIAKQRNGPVGTLKMAFIPSFTRFESLTNEQP